MLTDYCKEDTNSDIYPIGYKKISNDTLQGWKECIFNPTTLDVYWSYISVLSTNETNNITSYNETSTQSTSALVTSFSAEDQTFGLLEKNSTTTEYNISSSSSTTSASSVTIVYTIGNQSSSTSLNKTASTSPSRGRGQDTNLELVISLPIVGVMVSVGIVVLIWKRLRMRRENSHKHATDLDLTNRALPDTPVVSDQSGDEYCVINTGDETSSSVPPCESEVHEYDSISISPCSNGGVMQSDVIYVLDPSHVEPVDIVEQQAHALNGIDVEAPNEQAS